MKKKLIASLLCLSGVLPLAAQSQWGLMGGVNFSSTTNRDFTWKPGGYFGVMHDVELSKAWSFQPRLYVSYEHFKNRAWELPAWGALQPSYSQWNITLPLLASLKLNPGDQLVMRLNAGPYLQYAIGGRTETSYTNEENVHIGISESWHQSFGKHFSYGIYTGISGEKGHWMVNFDFKYSLRSSTLSPFAKHEASLSAGVGYKF